MGSVTAFVAFSCSILFTIRARRMGSRQLCIRTSRMGSVTAFVGPRSILFTIRAMRVSALCIRKPDGVGYSLW